MDIISQLVLLLWKKVLLQKHKPLVSLLEIVLPVFFAIMLLFFHIQTQPDAGKEYSSRPSYGYASNYAYRPFSDGTHAFLDDRLQITYAPKTPLTDRLMKRVYSKISARQKNESMLVYRSSKMFLEGFATEEKLVNYEAKILDVPLLAVVFRLPKGATTLPLTATYYIRPWSHYDAKKEWRTSVNYPFLHAAYHDFDKHPPYRARVMPLQSLVGEAIIAEWSGRDDLPAFDLSLQRMPYLVKEVGNPTAISLISLYLPIILALAFIFPIVHITKSIVYEKERKLKESMSLMGLRPAALWISWFIAFFIYLALAMAIYLIVVCVPFVSSGAILNYSDASLFYVFLLCYSFFIVSFCFFISACVQKANVGGATSGVTFILLFVPYFFVRQQYEEIPRIGKLALCLLMNPAMIMGCMIIGMYEAYGEGVKWSNINQPISVDDTIAFSDVLIMMTIGAAVNLSLAYYVNSFRPVQFGWPKCYFLFFKKSHLLRSPQSMKRRKTEVERMEDQFHFEPEPEGLSEGIKICNLSKTFGKKVAVSNISLKIYKGQITVLLGHPRTGKTTTLSMLTGFLDPGAGTAFVNKKEIRKDIAGVRDSLGLCPQQSILFDTLTVEEHLVFFAKLKGCPSTRMQDDVDNLIRELGLEAKRNAQAQTLSRSQKRQLSVAIALVGGSRVVILDEPTSGMDLAARRMTWEMLLRHRGSRAILLATQYMDEAEVLGDRIAIMAEGVVKCCGSSPFLKKLYGAGYNLSIVVTPTCNISEVTEFVQSFVPSALLAGDLNRELELSYLLPDDQSAAFPDLLRNLDFQRKKLGICSFRATATTMEDIFLKVGQTASREYDRVSDTKTRTMDGEVNEQAKMLSADVSTPTTVDVNALAFSQSYTRLTGLSLWHSRLRGVIEKKAILLWRQRFLTLFQLLLPILFTVLALSVDMLKDTFFNWSKGAVTPLHLSLEDFGETITPYAVRSRHMKNLAQHYLDQFSGYHNIVDINQPKRMNMTTAIFKIADDLGAGTFRRSVIFGAEFISRSAHSVEAKSWTNRVPYHSEPIALTYMLNALARLYSQNSRVKMEIGVHPFPAPEDPNDLGPLKHSIGLGFGFFVGFLLSVGMFFLTPSFVFFLIKERTVGAKHMQVVSGASPVVFWVSNFIMDYINYLIPSLLLLMVFGAFQTEAYMQDGRLGLVFLVLMLYGWAILPFFYLAQFIFTCAHTGMATCIVFNFLSGLLTLLTVFILGSYKTLGQTMDWIFLVVFPNHCMGRSFVEIYFNYCTNVYCDDVVNYTRTCLVRKNRCCRNYGLGCEGDFCLHFDKNYLSLELPGIGRYVLMMFAQGIFCFLIIIILEYRLFQRLFGCLSCFCRDDSSSNPAFGGTGGTMEDSDVAAERSRINASAPAELSKGDDSLLLVNLSRQYGNLVAVDHASLGVKERECFGLLGQSGAGKTTIFRTLTGEETVSGGNAYLKGYDIVHNLRKVQESIGYCPQSDALLDTMTGRETLTMYARLRGVPDDSIENCVDSLMDVLLLRQQADIMTRSYSDCDKRRLSTAIALIGDPPFVLLDEPTAGMDPGARKQLWNVLSEARANGRTLIFTSQSMEECEALCTRLAIMVNGRFVCMGSTQHLKSKFGQGYTLAAKMATLEDGTTAPAQPYMAHIQSNFPSVQLLDSLHGYIHLQILDHYVLLADLFEAMEHSKNELHVQDYHVHRTTLEHVFLAFTRHQTPLETNENSYFSKPESKHDYQKYNAVKEKKEEEWD